MLTIAKFAEACGLSVPALRRYDEAGVLVPAEVDARTGHREGSTHVGGAVSVACFALAATYPAAHLVGAAFGAAGTVAVLVLSPRASRSSRTRRRRPPGAGPHRRC